MALDDVVQGVKVNVQTDGVDDAKNKIGQLEDALHKIAKTAEDASGGGTGGGAGIGSLTKAFSDLSSTGAEAFANIAKSAASGDITGLATLIGGRLGGSVVEAGKAIGDFIDTQDRAILKNAAMAKEFGTTPDVIQGLKESFEGAGVSAGGFERLVSRMSRQVTNDYASMVENIRTDSARQTKAADAVQSANLKVLESVGVPKASLESQQKSIEQSEALADRQEALEAQRQAALRSLPLVSAALRTAQNEHRELANIDEISTQTLRKSIENLARTGQGPADPINVLKTEFDLIQSGAIGSQKAVELLSQQMGQMRATGLGGVDAANAVTLAQSRGSGAITAAQQGKSRLQELGLASNDTDTENASKFIENTSRVTGLLDAMMKKIGSYGAGVTAPAVKSFGDYIESLVTTFTAPQFTDKIKAWNQAGQQGSSLIGGLVSGATSLLERGAKFLGMDKAGSTLGAASSFANRFIGDGGDSGGPAAPAAPPNVVRFGQGAAPAGGPQVVSGFSPSGGIIHIPQPGANAPPSPYGSNPYGGIIQGGRVQPFAAPQQPPQLQRNVPPPPPGSAIWKDDHWQSISNFAGGGLIPGFADGGVIGLNPLIAKLVQTYGPKAYEYIKKEGLNKFSEEAISENAAHWTEKGIGAGLETAGIEGAEAVAGTAVGVLSNPFGTGLLDSSETDAADFKAGAHNEATAGKWMGARNALEAEKARREGRDIAMWSGGLIPGFAQGSIKGPGTGTSDSILARLSNGEFVMKNAAVRTYGEGFMHAINNMQLPAPKYAMGGMVPNPLPRFADGGMGKPDSVLHLHVGGEVFGPMKAPDHVASSLRKFAINQQTTSTGRKPSWST